MATRRAYGAVAVDLGASSARFAAGWIDDGRLRWEVVEQIPHAPSMQDGRLVWDVEALLGICRRALAYGRANFEHASLGIDTWGVDIGFFDPDEKLQPPIVCYRDLSHAAEFNLLASHRSDIYARTGIQHQPFNTLYQLAARGRDMPSLKDQVWLPLPDALLAALGAPLGGELTHCSTSQLLNLSGAWAREIFDLIEWPVPKWEPEPPGRAVANVESVDLIRVAGHDTASAVFGLGHVADDQAFLAMGTWSLLGCLLSEPLATAQAEAANFTNERAADGRIRFLANIPGSYVLNRLHDELRLEMPISDWINGADLEKVEPIDLLDPALFNPASMVEAIAERAQAPPANERQWAGLAILSLAATTADRLRDLERLTGRRFTSIRACGGPSQSEVLVETVARACGVPVQSGPKEATLIGNLALQLIATGQCRHEDLSSSV
jgi:rhamnulokinase